ncbi:MAG: hypothetical protein ACJAVM_002975 [Sulfitobacter sp.]|jgi:hypothetical protein
MMAVSSLSSLRALAFGAALLLAAPASAGVFYECDMNTKHPRGWVSPKVTFAFDAAGHVSVTDGVILWLYQKPLIARTRKKGEKLRITWNIANAEAGRGERIPTFRYIANLNTATKAVSIIAKPVGYPQRFSAKGLCTIKTK